MKIDQNQINYVFTFSAWDIEKNLNKKCAEMSTYGYKIASMTPVIEESTNYVETSRVIVVFERVFN